METTAQFNFSNGITTDGINLYITDTNNNMIRQSVIATVAVTTLAGSSTVVISTGQVSTIAGSYSEGYVDGALNIAQFSYPGNMGFYNGNLYLSDSGNDAIRDDDITNNMVSMIAGSSTAGNVDGTNTQAEFNSPEFLADLGWVLVFKSLNDDFLKKTYKN